MASLLVVPIHLDALYVETERIVVAPSADFTALPHVDNGTDIHPNTPFLSEAILSQPFEDVTFRLRPGIHLHWALPDSLTHATGEEAQLDFPAVPARWLVTRSRSGKVEQQWVVESDFIAEDNRNSISYPYIPEQMTKSLKRPFGFLGRFVPLSLWKAGGAVQDYLDKLTAVGYGDPAFAAFYPNCHSVFGFFDEHGLDAPTTGLRYDVLGWYANLTPAQTDVIMAWAADRVSSEAAEWQQALKDEFAWEVPESASLPTRMICYAQLTFQDPSPKRSVEEMEAGVSVGNTLSEALSAHLQRVFPEATDLENLLEAIQFADDLEQQQLDVTLGIHESRHESTFRPITAGTVWTLRQETTTQEPTLEQTHARQNATLPDELATELDALNGLQARYDASVQEILELQSQTYADWYKFMVSMYPPENTRETYPDIDETLHFIQVKDLAPLLAKMAATGQLPVSGEGETLAHQLTRQKTRLEARLDNYNQNLITQAGMRYTLSQVAAPRFYQPNEPVVLMTGDVAKPSDRHGQDGRLHPDGLLACSVLESISEGAFLSAEGLNGLRQQTLPLFDGLDSDQVGITVWTEQPWHPVLLQWEVEYFPTSLGNNLDPASRRFSPQFIDDNYQLSEDGVELTVRPGKYIQDKSASIYSGTTLLSPAAEDILTTRILSYLEKHALPEYLAHNPIPEAEQTPTYWEDHQDEVFTWYRANGQRQDLKTLIQVYQHLIADEGSNLAQALDGFNQALLMHNTVPQIPVDDPLGFPLYQAFTQTVRVAVGLQNTSAPLPLSDFNPIRAGALKLLRLRLVDNFGETLDVNLGNMSTTTQLSVPDFPDWVALPPRIVQPARVNFRWLSAIDNTAESNSHPVTTPICGWLMPNHLDDSLMVYHADGGALGAIYALADEAGLAEWRAAPGLPPINAGAIDGHLGAVVNWLIGKGAEFVGDFIDAIDTALATIDPENDEQHSGQAFLMGRPVAVVRAMVNLELLAPPAINESWNHFRLDLTRSSRDDDGFTQVKFPIRIGEYQALNDGLVGYWEEDLSYRLSSKFYAPQSHPDSSALHPDIVTMRDGQPINLLQALGDPAHTLTLLMDPRGVVHATSGILPTKDISLPADQYREALEKIEVTFFTAPWLHDAHQLDLPLPDEEGYVWSWVQKQGQTWDELSTLPSVRKADFVAAVSNGETVWGQLLVLGWLQHLDDATALVTPAERRQALLPELQSQQAEIESALDVAFIVGSHTRAHFLIRPTVSEGWLRLRPIRKPDSETV